jgi:tetratricopeptide (TPR) repeat protein
LGETLSQAQALDWIKQILEILTEVHQRGFFHRDIKPSNIILKPNGKLALIDFGTAREVTPTYFAKLGSNDEYDSELTQIISVGYTAPEQIKGRAVPQSDFYALGRTIVHLVTRKHPCDLPYDNDRECLKWRDQAQQISKPVADFIDELMAASPEDRPKSAGKILSYLNERQLKRRRFYKITRQVALTTIGVGIAVNYLLFPFVVEYFFNQGRQDLVQQDFEGAAQNYKRALMLDPDDLTIINNLALVCKIRKDYICTLESYQQGLALTNSDFANKDPAAIAIFHYGRGIFFEDIREFDRAFEAYAMVMQDGGEIGITATNNFVRLKIWRNQDAATTIPLLTQTLNKTEDPRLKSGLYKNLGWAYALEGQLPEAKKSLEQSIQLDSDRRAAPYCLLAKVEQLQAADATENWQKCRDYNSENLPEVETWQNDAVQALSTANRSVRSTSSTP